MTRQIVLDTETTGLSAENGDRVIELGCVELFNRKLTGNDLHIYFNPERESHEDALKVHGLTTDFLRDKPKFATLANDVVDYLRDAELIIHNAAFDVGFLNKEFELAGLPSSAKLRRRGDRHAGHGEDGVSRQAQFSRRAVRSLRGRSRRTAPSTAPSSTRNCWPMSTSTSRADRMRC